MITLIVYLIGVFAARLQLQYWFKDELLTEDDCKTLMILSALSWGIYPAYVIDNIINRIKSLGK